MYLMGISFLYSQSSHLTLKCLKHSNNNYEFFLQMWLELPHGVQQRPVIFDPQQFIGHGHVVSHRLFPVVKEGVRSPDFTRHQIVEGQNIHRPMKCQPLILPALPEENIYGVLLWTEEEKDKSNHTAKHLLILLLINLFDTASFP